MPIKNIRTKKRENSVAKTSVKKIIRKEISPAVPMVKEDNSLTGGENVERILVENFVSLQKVIVNLSSKMDNLINQISQLLNLFEISAKALAEKGSAFEGAYDKRIIEKMDNLIDQNKTLARGISLLHEGETAQPQHQDLEMQQQAQDRNFPLQQSASQNNNPETYQKSISSGPKPFSRLPRR